ncbi:interleukin-1 receptor-associated kinase-like 2 isoform X2 [Sceloporus undulatus]|uniref:interleukin-1 receptor-associated kinase-like 2 isoform X2 n=1 Tax=Sceloporus undulatus TaxID=8520 RepID=UPI001C4BD400|nr:interleukin-1 receptor-associated kinase-like 2 isoform X2 [Sceloporus undulatus]
MAKGGKHQGIPTPVSLPEKEEMAQQQHQWCPLPSVSPGGPAAAAPSPSPPPEYIHSLPAWVLEDFCQKMDCLNDYDWMRFASNVITDQTELRKIKCMEKAGISITRELMWWWGVRLATVQQLLNLLQELQLYHAAQVIAYGTSLSFAHDSVRPSQQWNSSLHPTGNKQKKLPNEPEVLPPPDSDPVLKADGGIRPLSPPPISVDLPHSLRSNVKPCSASVSQQENIPNFPKSVSPLWSSGEVETATSGFSEENRISEGIFAITYKGRRDSTTYVVKKLKENQTQRFFHTEVQIYFRCCHPNILQLLGFCVESVFHCLIYPYMPNGSLMDRLQCQGGSESLSWEKRIKISLGLIQAIQHLHQLRVIHGNVKSSNVLLDANFAPQLGHSGLRLHPVEKKSNRAMMKTKVLQASLAYFSEDFVRHGQLTEKVDIFGCGIVLAEILTGMKAMDEDRHPVFLKDALLEEIEVAKDLSSSQERTFERLAAMEMCRKYQDKQAVCLPETTTVCLAMAICVCLRKKKADLAEVNEIVKMADHQIQHQKMLQGSSYFGLSVNIPEETNDEPASPFTDSFSSNLNYKSNVNSASLNCKYLLPPLTRAVPPETYSGQLLRVPCESDESSNFSWDPLKDAGCQIQSNSHQDLENISLATPLTKDLDYSNDFTAENMDFDRSMKPQEARASSNKITPPNRENTAADFSSQEANEIKINQSKKKLMEKIVLYEEKKINSYDLFKSSV